MDHGITVSCSATESNLTMLRDVAEAWGLRYQGCQRKQGHFSITYVRPTLNFELITTWDVGYYILDRLLAHRANREDSAEVRLQFSSLEGDEAVLTSAEVEVDAPCTCHGEQLSADFSHVDQQCAWEAEALSVLPHVSSLVSAAIPEPWAFWLPENCEVRGEGSGVIWYGNMNCNYLVFHQRIIANCGYHGDAVFNVNLGQIPGSKPGPRRACTKNDDGLSLLQEVNQARGESSS